MQQVLNAQERSNAFWKFLLYFVITVALVVIAVYFDFRVPAEQNKKLLQASAAQNFINDGEEKFITKMNAVSRLLDTLDKPGVNVSFINSQISDGITDLLKYQGSDNPFYAKLNETVVNRFLALQEKKNAAIKQANEITELAKERDKLMQEVSDLKSNQPAQIYPGR